VPRKNVTLTVLMPGGSGIVSEPSATDGGCVGVGLPTLVADVTWVTAGSCDGVAVT